MRKRSEVQAPARGGDETPAAVAREVEEAVARDRSEYRPMTRTAEDQHSVQAALDSLPSRETVVEDLTDRMRSVKPGGTEVRVNADGTTTVTLNWGEEKYGIQGSYSACTVGPFGLTFTVARGALVAEAAEAGMQVLARYAEMERERKVRNFMDKLARVQGAGARS
jgi:hypothetical protein